MTTSESGRGPRINPDEPLQWVLLSGAVQEHFRASAVAEGLPYVPYDALLSFEPTDDFDFRREVVVSTMRHLLRRTEYPKGYGLVSLGDHEPVPIEMQPLTIATDSARLDYGRNAKHGNIMVFQRQEGIGHPKFMKAKEMVRNEANLVFVAHSRREIPPYVTPIPVFG